MIVKVFTIYDSKAEAYLTPFFSKATGEAIRSFTTVVNESGHQFNKYPEDFTLFELGTYDDCTAKFDSLITPVSLGKALEFVTQV